MLTAAAIDKSKYLVRKSRRPYRSHHDASDAVIPPGWPQSVDPVCAASAIVHTGFDGLHRSFLDITIAICVGSAFLGGFAAYVPNQYLPFSTRRIPTLFIESRLPNASGGEVRIRIWNTFGSGDVPWAGIQALSSWELYEGKDFMALITSLIAKLRHDPQPLLKLPPYISSLLILVGIIWLLLLPLNEYSRQTYISENALLPGQVHTYFSGSEQNIFRGYRQELDTVKDKDYHLISEKLQSILRESGLKVATQDYKYHSAGREYSGQNVYSVIHAPRGDGTEAIVLMAGWKAIDGRLNLHGVSLALTLARYFKRWSLWSKDIIFLITPDSSSGAQAWVDAYHDMHPSTVQPLPLKSGAIQGAIAFEHPQNHRFESLHVLYDGVNGQLPNLDLVNTAVAVANGQMGIPLYLQQVWDHDNSYKMRLQTMLQGMMHQGLGHATGLHSCFIPYHIDAITFQAVGHGWHDEMGLGRSIEGLVRSINNLLEHFHQSFFFYLLMHTNRFVSIGTYLPSAMLIAGNFTIMAIALWVKSGHRPPSSTSTSTVALVQSENSNKETKERNEAHPILEESNGVVERHLTLPLILVFGLHFLGTVPLFAFNNLPYQTNRVFKLFSRAAYVLTAANIIFPFIISAFVTRILHPTVQQLLLIKSFSLVLLGLFLSALATLNFSLSLFLGLLCSPLTFVGSIDPTAQNQTSKLSDTNIVKAKKDSRQISTLRLVQTGIELSLLQLISPTAILLGICQLWRIPVETVLSEAAFGWNVWGMWTQVAVWCIWWPAWLTGCTLLISLVLI
ncbi:Glycosyl phosphatidyl inositol protein transamidase complex subunit [Myotisia sp. PD_48]|nr:Glycosyl phosphatidyl inositol protein transamidase complex subunit [Myotisia sp. PD_48]